MKNTLGDPWRPRIGLLLGPLLALVTWLWPIPTLSDQAHHLAAIMVFVMVCWISEPLPLALTGLLGVTAAIALHIGPTASTLASFTDPIIFLFIGSFMIAKALQIHGVDRRIAYALLATPWVGNSTLRTQIALAGVAWLVAMWMGITASVIMLFPVAQAMAKVAEEAISAGDLKPESQRYTTGLLLLLTYAASAGAMATPVGTPPNLIGISLIQQELGIRIGFIHWMILALPLTLLLLVTRVGLVHWLFPPEQTHYPGQTRQMQQKYTEMGPWTQGQYTSLAVLALAIFLWILPSGLNLFLGTHHPWAQIIQERLAPGYVAMFSAGLLFILPTDWKTRCFTLTWKEGRRIDWQTILLFGSGIALGRLMFESGLAASISHSLMGPILQLHPMYIIAGAIGVAVFMSEIASNTAAANMVIPVMLSLVPQHPTLELQIVLAATLATSLGFLLPISTPANAIIAGVGPVRMRDFLRGGLSVDILSAALIWLFCSFVYPALLGSLFPL